MGFKWDSEHLFSVDLHRPFFTLLLSKGPSKQCDLCVTSDQNNCRFTVDRMKACCVFLLFESTVISTQASTVKCSNVCVFVVSVCAACGTARISRVLRSISVQALWSSLLDRVWGPAPVRTLLWTRVLNPSTAASVLSEPCCWCVSSQLHNLIMLLDMHRFPSCVCCRWPWFTARGTLGGGAFSY